MTPRQIAKLLAAALEFHGAGRLKEALVRYERVLAADPRNFDALHLAGTLALQQGRSADALQLLEKARRLAPGHAICAMRLAVALVEAGRLGEAEELLRASAKLDPELPEAWFHLGFVRWLRGRPEDAAAAYGEAIARRPGYAEAHDRLGALITKTHGYAAAEPHFRKAVESEPRLATGWANLGIALLYQGHIAEALDSLQRALNLNPQLEAAHTARGVALERCYDIPGALSAYADALRINPGNAEARSARLMALQYAGAARAALSAAHRAYGSAVESIRRPAARRFPQAASPERPLRIGFLSPNLYRHSIAYFLEPLLAHLDSRQFQVHLYHDSPISDEVSARLSRRAAWRTVTGVSDDVVEATIRADSVDILFDLAGHTGLNRLPLFARRLAPVQATYLGYPDTTGLSSMDYRLVDPFTDPAGDADRLCTEKLLRFAPTAWTYAPPSGAAQPETRTHGPGGVVFGCFNNFAKASDATLGLWGRVLEAVPGSRLLLKSPGLADPALSAAVRRRMAAAGLDESRVDLLNRMDSVSEHLAAYGRIDIALDTYPYHGTTTTCEALWMGVPVVSLCGDRHASRVGASLLAAVGRPDWCAGDEAGYVRIAAELADRIESVRCNRAALREAMRRSPLLDHAGQAARFGAACREMWRAWCARGDAIAA